MAHQTPDATDHDGLGPMQSRYVDVAALPWRQTRFEGVSIKMLMEDPETGLHTSLTRFEPGASLPMHEHVGLEQSFVLEGSLVDEEGTVTAGNYVWRPAGSKHVAHAPNGAIVLGIFHKPNKFFDDAAGE